MTAALEDGSRRRMGRADRENQILDAAESVFGRRGYHDTTMEDIAAACGVTKALLYQYFGVKDDLYVACIDRAQKRLFEHIEAVVLDVTGPKARVVAFVREFFGALDRGAAWWLVFGEATGRVINPFRDRNAKLIARLIARTIGRSEDDPDLQYASHVLTGAGEQVGRWWVTQTAVSRQDVERRHVDLVWLVLNQLATSG